MVTNAEDYDANIWLFNVQNGVVDLKTGAVSLHDRTRLLSKISPAVYDPTATCPLWNEFLVEVLETEEMIDFVSRAAAYSLTGDINEQAVFFLHGSGANGKSVFLEVLLYILGDYSRVCNFDTFVVKKHDSKSDNDMAQLVGRRLVLTSESQDGHRLNEALLKQITGGDLVEARFLYKERFNFLPQFKLWFSSNYTPAIRGTDEGIWRRMKLIPFEVTIPEERRDRRLIEKLRAEASGIFNWLLRGMARYNQIGLAYPKKVSQATSQYKAEQDVIGQFLLDRTRLNPLAKVKGAELYSTFKWWAGANREFVLTERQFTKALLRNQKISTEKREDGKWYVGVQLIVGGPVGGEIPEDVI